ncbi:phosphoesterase [Leptospira sp. FAT2]|uniref:PHP domain-containing protein n=1 Tax=Leptospira sanjuanensis TaxID=2879643 RepID=UPI001EE9612C|nr:phosphoesterase [Leptospira sanjuanensis]MCG6193519.1 phosphoesterase [Leptospira sanjuanensis]
MAFKRRIHPRIWRRILGAFAFLGVTHFLTSFLLYQELDSHLKLPFFGNRIHSSYSSTKHRWLKFAFHLHSDRDGFSPFRSPPREIQEKYLDKRYDLVGITDYLKISGIDSKEPRFFPGYEWGRDFNRKHILALGTKVAVPDFFPLYASAENIQWTIDQMHKSGAFVSISHPGLEGSISYSLIERLRGVDAVEVFSPYGDTFQEWIRLLDQGTPILATSGDDLHYFPGEFIRAMKLPLYQRIFHELTFSEQNAGDAFVRYVLLNTNSYDPKEITANLKKGNYVSVIKLVDYMDDPKISELRLDRNTIVAEFPKTFIKAEFIGKGGTILKEERQKQKAEFTIRPEDGYVILRVVFPSGSIVSNPFYRIPEPEENQTENSLDPKD